jgi:hypothetical protein
MGKMQRSQHGIHARILFFDNTPTQTVLIQTSRSIELIKAYTFIFLPIFTF